MRPRPLFALACLALTFSYSGVAYAQTSPAASQTLRAVEQRARQDAQTERPRATVQDLNALYGERARAEGISLEQVLDAYEAAYTAARPPRSFWKEYLPHLGWATAVVLFVLTFFRDTFRDVLGPRLKAVGDKLYDRVAGYPVFWWKARGNYRKSLVGLYKRFKIPFMADRYLDMDQIYVPLKVEGASDVEQVVDFSEVAHYWRLVVTGQPGSGKSMLLRRLALLHATTGQPGSGLLRRLTLLLATRGLRKLPDHPTPVLLELHRLNKDDRGVFEHLVEIFRLHKFPEADSFIRRSLRRGRLILLFDGLDEVDSARRAGEVKKLKDFIQEYDRCRVIVTCRTAVYRGEFDELADRRLQIVDFSDAQIESFLKAWPDMPPNKSVGQLLAALDERPLIKALARRPLLLTIIAFLYTEVEDFRLPYSRADFYKRAADVLLGGLKGELNKYEAVEKQLVLEHLALYNQTKQAQNEDDRLTLDRQTVLGEIRRLLPEMARKEEDAPSVLEEIVERSSLLLPLDNKSRYVFSHLTLQEYFAASALKANHARLLEHFAADRDAWRETAKLWCGLAQDSTEFVSALFRLEPLTALECIADAKRLAPETADAIIDHFKQLLGSEDGPAEAIAKALGVAATGDSPRNRRVYGFLIDSIQVSNTPSMRAAAATALSLTNNPEAASWLARVISEVPVAEAALVRMGDLAIPAIHAQLYAQAEVSHVQRVVRALAAIGTPKAVEALVNLLWDYNAAGRMFAALFLGSRLHLPQVESAVRAARLPPHYRQEEWYKWVWSPFQEGESTMAVVAGRIGFLVELATIEFPFKHLIEHPAPSRISNDFTLDPRIILPLVLYLNQRGAHPSYAWRDVLKILSIPPGPLHDYQRSDIDRLSDGQILEILRRAQIENPAREMMTWSSISIRMPVNVFGALSLLDAPRQIRLLYRLADDKQPTLEHWRNIFRPFEFAFEGSLYHHATSLGLLTLPPLSIASFILTLRASSVWLAPNIFILAALLLAVAVVWMGSVQALKPAEKGFIAQTLIEFLLFGPFNPVWPRLGSSAAVSNLDIFFLTLYLPINIYLGSSFFGRWLDAPWVTAMWVLLLGPLYAFYWLGKRKERRSGNPLIGLLDKPKAEKAERVVR